MSTNNPYNIEIGIISKILETKDINTVKDYQIKPYYFDEPECRKAFNFINKHFSAHGEVPTIRVFTKSFEDLKLDSYRSSENNQDIIGTEEPLHFWCNEIRLKKKHNKICDIIEEAIDEVEKSNTEKAYEIIKKGILYVESDLVETQAIDVTKDAESRKELYKKRQENRGMIGIPMGFPEIDVVLKGMQSKQLITLLAKTGIGKTWIEVLLACNCCLGGYKVLFFTTEMSEEQIEDRIEATLVRPMTGVDFNYGHFKSGTLPKEQEEAYFQLLDEKSSLEPIIIETATGVSNVNAKIEQYKPDIVFIDGAYLMEDDRGAKDDWLRVAHITRDLKTLAKQKKLPIFINTQADSTTSKKTGPELENIGFSKAIGMDSDVVLALFRDEDMIEDREMKFKILKQREGTLGNVMLNWDFSRMNFEPIYSEVTTTEVKQEDRGLISLGGSN